MHVALHQKLNITIMIKTTHNNNKQHRNRREFQLHLPKNYSIKYNEFLSS